MYLYELALELDLRSLDLAARAHELGVEGVGPNSELTDAQVRLLRSSLGGAADQAGSAPAPAAGPAALPAAVPTGIGSPSLFASPGSAPPPVPAFRPPPSAPAPPGGSSPSYEVAGPEDWSREPERAAALPPVRRQDPKRRAIVLKLALAAAVVFAVGLVAFMAKDAGMDDDRLAELRTTEPEADAGTDGPVDVASLGEPVDLATYCENARSVRELEDRMSGALGQPSWRSARASYASDLKLVTTALRKMVGSGPPGLAGDLRAYIDHHDAMGAIVWTDDTGETARAEVEAALVELAPELARMAAVEGAHCR